MSGIMGLAFSNLAFSHSTPFWQTLAQASGVLESPLFAIQITRFSSDTNQNANPLQPGGSLSLGVADTSLFTGDIDYQDIPDTTSGFWLQQLVCKTRFYVQSPAICLNSFCHSDDCKRQGYCAPVWKQRICRDRFWYHWRCGARRCPGSDFCSCTKQRTDSN